MYPCEFPNFFSIGSPAGSKYAYTTLARLRRWRLALLYQDRVDLYRTDVLAVGAPRSFAVGGRGEAVHAMVCGRFELHPPARISAGYRLPQVAGHPLSACIRFRRHPQQIASTAHTFAATPGHTRLSFLYRWQASFESERPHHLILLKVSLVCCCLDDQYLDEWIGENSSLNKNSSSGIKF